jgi:hypothetical protein
LSGSKRFAVVVQDFRHGCDVQEMENLDEQLDPGKDQRRLGNHFAAGALRRGHGRLRRDIAVSNIFGEKRPQQVVACGRVE